MDHVLTKEGRDRSLMELSFVDNFVITTYTTSRLIEITFFVYIGIADPHALNQTVAAYQACHFIGMPECDVSTIHTIIKYVSVNSGCAKVFC